MTVPLFPCGSGRTVDLDQPDTPVKKNTTKNNPFLCPVSLFTSTCLFVQELVASGALALEADRPVHADVGAAAVVDHTLVQSWERKEEREEVKKRANQGGDGHVASTETSKSDFRRELRKQETLKTDTLHPSV